MQREATAGLRLGLSGAGARTPSHPALILKTQEADGNFPITVVPLFIFCTSQTVLFVCPLRQNPLHAMCCVTNCVLALGRRRVMVQLLEAIASWLTVLSPSLE